MYFNTGEDMEQEGLSYGLSEKFADWINDCYSLCYTEEDEGAFLKSFCRALCNFTGVYGAWVFKSCSGGSKPDQQVSFGHHAIDTIPGIIRIASKGCRNFKEPWTVSERSFNNRKLAADLSVVHPADSLKFLDFTGFNYNGEITLTVLLESGISGLLSKIIGGMFPTILQMMKNRFGNEDSMYRFLLENQNELVVKVDAAGRFLFVSPTYCKLFGLKEKDLIGKTFIPLIHPDDRETTLHAMKQLNVSPHTCYIEQRAQTAQGWRWLAWSDKAIPGKDGSIESIIGVGRDITDHKKTEQELFESENKFQKAFFNSPNLMSITRFSDGEILDVNRKFLQFIGIPEKDMYGRKTVELGIYSISDREAIKKIIEQDGRLENYELTLNAKNGEVLEGLISSEIIELNGEKCMVTSFQDITDLRKLQRELEDYKLHLERIVEQRTIRVKEINDELSRFTNSVCHDLKAPLRAMQGFAGALKEDHSGNFSPEADVYLSRILHAAELMDNLITDLLQYSKVSIQEVVLLPVDLNKIIGKAVFMLNEDINNKKAVIRIKPGLPQVIAFAPAMVIVFTNLISNALKFVDERTIPLISISGSLKGGKAIIRFRDNGIGIPSEKHKLIFEVFEKLHGIESYPGYGIGLAIVKKSLERMGGEVSVLSEVGKGSTFVLKLQAAE